MRTVVDVPKPALAVDPMIEALLVHVKWMMCQVTDQRFFDKAAQPYAAHQLTVFLDQYKLYETIEDYRLVVFDSYQIHRHVQGASIVFEGPELGSPGPAMTSEHHFAASTSLLSAVARTRLRDVYIRIDLKMPDQPWTTTTVSMFDRVAEDRLAKAQIAATVNPVHTHNNWLGLDGAAQ